MSATRAIRYLACAAVLLCSAWAAAAPGDYAGGDPYAQTRELLELAPSRQVGQPGNDAVDHLIAQRFSDVVERQNRRIDAERWSAAQALAAKADAADAALTAAIDRIQIGGAAMQSVWWVRMLFEEPAFFTFLAAAIGAILYVGYRFEKRKRLLWGSGVLLAIAVALPISAYFIDTAAESAAKSGGGDDEQLKAQAMGLDQASRAALRADIEAANALRGFWQTGRVVYPTAAFIPGKATLSAGDVSVRLYQLAPNLVEPGNLPAEGFNGALVNATRAAGGLSGDATTLTGAAVLLDFDTGLGWLDAVVLGADVVILVEPQDEPTTLPEAATKLSNSPLSVPRFFLRQEDLATLKRALGERWADADVQVRIEQEPGRWERREVAADWLFIPAVPGPDAPEKPGLVHLQAYKDSASVVPELSPGAASATNLVLMLRLLDEFDAAGGAPNRPVLLSVVNNHANALHGEAEFAYFAFVHPQLLLDELTELNRELANQRLIHQVYSEPPSAERVVELRSRIDWVGGKAFTVKSPVVEALRKRRERGVLPEGEVDPVIELMQAFNRLGKQVDYATLTPEQKQRLAGVFEDVANQAGRELRTLERHRDVLKQNLAMRRRLLALSNELPQPNQIDSMTATEARSARFTPIPATAALTFDLAYGSDRLGCFADGMLNKETQRTDWAQKRIGRLARHTLALAADVAAQTGAPAPFDDTLMFTGGLSWEAHLTPQKANAAVAFHQFRIPGLTITSVRDAMAQAFTPHDTLERIDPDRLRELVRFTQAFAMALVRTPRLEETWLTIGNPYHIAAEIIARQHDEVSTDVPQTVVPEALVVMTPSTVPMRAIDQLGQVRPYLILAADDRGRAVVRGDMWYQAHAMIFGYDEQFRKVTAALDFNEGERRFPSALTQKNYTFTSFNMILTEACKTDVFGLTQPLTLAPSLKLEVLDASRNSLPRRFSTAGMPAIGPALGKKMPLAANGTASIFMPPETRFKLRNDDAPVIAGTDEEPTGLGFAAEVGRVRNVALVGATDMHRLNRTRLDLLQTKGVSNETAVRLNEAAGQRLEQVAEASEEGRQGVIQAAAQRARGTAFRAYTLARGTLNDLIKAVVIFLALIAPFCFFVMKLVTPFTDVNRQLTLFGVIFFVTVVLLQFIHPAFDPEVSQTPHVVILAFIILGLATFVCSVIMTRFNASMNQAIEASQLSESVDAPQGRLVGTAFMVGVNNMKRRRIRTALTAATVVLVTFTTLSVMSVGQSVGAAQARLKGPAPYDGFVYIRPGMGPINPIQFENLRVQLDQPGVTASVARMWVQRQNLNGEYLPYRLTLAGSEGGENEPSLRSLILLGMEPAEHGLIQPMPLTPGSSWFSATDAMEIVLSVEGAQVLGLSPDNFHGKLVRVSGMDLKLVGLVDDERLAEMRDIGDVPLLPLLARAGADVQKQVADAQTETSAADVGTSVTATPGMELARAIDIAILPLETARLVSGGYGDYRSLSVKYLSGGEGATSAAARAWADANEVIQFQHARLMVGLTEGIVIDDGASSRDAGQWALVATSSTQIGGVLRVAIPIALGATIIFNTMLGSVVERKREIGIYNAIGLNPTHVIMFFLAESLVFGLVGSVAGYLIGQILSVLITRFNLIELNLNYSSLSVIVVIFITIVTVLLSALYPAMMAARAAVPSGQRRWSLPKPDGDQIHLVFPFVYDPTRVMGICAYLYEFLKQNTDASTGKFLAKLGPVGTVPSRSGAPADATPGADGNKSLAMLFDIAPAPFDLGVNQKMEVYAFHNPRVGAYMLGVHLTRVSGERGNWVAVNQPFLEAMRKRLLGWRSQREQTQQTYIEEGRRLFDGAPELPTCKATGPQSQGSKPTATVS